MMENRVGHYCTFLNHDEVQSLHNFLNLHICLLVLYLQVQSLQEQSVQV